MDVDTGTGMKRSRKQDEDDYKRSRVSTVHAVTEVVTKKGKLAVSLNEDPEELRLLFDTQGTRTEFPDAALARGIKSEWNSLRDFDVHDEVPEPTDGTEVLSSRWVQMERLRRQKQTCGSWL